MEINLLKLKKDGKKIFQTLIKTDLLDNLRQCSFTSLFLNFVDSLFITWM